MNKTQEFLTRIEELQKQEIPAKVMTRARQSLLDYIAVTSAGAGFQ